MRRLLSFSDTFTPKDVSAPLCCSFSITTGGLTHPQMCLSYSKKTLLHHHKTEHGPVFWIHWGHWWKVTKNICSSTVLQYFHVMLPYTSTLQFYVTFTCNRSIFTAQYCDFYLNINCIVAVNTV